LAVEHSTQFVNSCQRKTALKAHFPFSLGSIIDEDRLRVHPKGLSQAINCGKAKVPLCGFFVSLCSTSDSAVRPKPQLSCFGQGGLTQLPFSAKEFNLRKIDAKHIVLHIGYKIKFALAFSKGKSATSDTFPLDITPYWAYIIYVIHKKRLGFSSGKSSTPSRKPLTGVLL